MNILKKTIYFVLLCMQPYFLQAMEKDSTQKIVHGKWEQVVRKKGEKKETLFAQLRENKTVESVVMESQDSRSFWKILVTITKKESGVEKLFFDDKLFKKNGSKQFQEPPETDEGIEITFPYKIKQKNNTTGYQLFCKEAEESGRGIFVRDFWGIIETSTLSFPSHDIFFEIRKTEETTSLCFSMPGLKIAGSLPETTEV